MTDLHYDCDDAIEYIMHRTALPRDIVQRSLMAKDIYEMMAGVLPADWLDGVEGVDVDLRALRSTHADLLPSEPNCAPWDLETVFVSRQPGLTLGIAVDCLAADIGYMIRQGIMDPGAEEAYRAGAYGGMHRRDLS